MDRLILYELMDYSSFIYAVNGSRMQTFDPIEKLNLSYSASIDQVRQTLHFSFGYLRSVFFSCDNQTLDLFFFFFFVIDMMYLINVGVSSCTVRTVREFYVVHEGSF